MKPARVILATVLLAAGFAGGFGYGRWYGPVARQGVPGQPKQRKILYYVDPMHPAYKSDKPGIAPDCGMTLEPVYEDGLAGPPKSARTVLKYRDPQLPNYTSDKPGINPETGNTLEPVYGDAAAPLGTIQITPEKQQMMGVQFGTVEYTNTGETLRTVGKVAMDETRLVHVHSRLDGWVERVYTDFTGAFVHKGDPMLTLYSPEMLASQKEYLLALRARDVMRSGGAIQSAVANSDTLLDASRKRLELWDLSKPQIEQLERTGEPIRATTIYAPAGGYVISRNSFPNLRVTPETELYTIADLSRVWIVADVFEADIPKIRIGQMAKVSLPGQPSGSFNARIDYLQPQLDAQTRTLKARMQVANPATRLKPEMFVDVEFPLASSRQLTVPVEAVLDAGQRQTVFVDRGDGYLEPRQVEIGDRLDDRVVILSGLKEGERIVTSANFLIDSESQLKSAMAGMSGPARSSATSSNAPPNHPAREGAHQ
jgi:RND family efflux transporter MFP subunit